MQYLHRNWGQARLELELHLRRMRPAMRLFPGHTILNPSRDDRRYQTLLGVHRMPVLLREKAFFIFALTEEPVFAVQFNRFGLFEADSENFRQERYLDPASRRKVRADCAVRKTVHQNQKGLCV